MRVKKFSLVDTHAGGTHAHNPDAGGTQVGDADAAVGASKDMDAFLVVDLDGAEAATGTVRCAKKVLVDGARSMARSETYAWALMGRRNSGASAGINAVADDAGAATSLFNEACSTQDTADWLDGAALSLRPGKGVPAEADETHDMLRRHAVVAATAAALGGLDGRSVTIESGLADIDALTALLVDRGAAVDRAAVADLAGSTTDALICGSKLGVIDHDIAAGLVHSAIIPAGPSPLTARAFAVSRRRGATVVAGFLTECGPLFEHLWSLGQEGGTPPTPQSLAAQVEQFVAGHCEDFAAHPDGPFMAACYRAEEFLATWQEDLPFGRPLA